MVLRSLRILLHILFKWPAKPIAEAFVLSVYFPMHFMGGENSDGMYSSNLSPLWLKSEMNHAVADL